MISQSGQPTLKVVGIHFKTKYLFNYVVENRNKFVLCVPIFKDISIFSPHCALVTLFCSYKDCSSRILIYIIIYFVYVYNYSVTRVCVNPQIDCTNYLVSYVKDQIKRLFMRLFRYLKILYGIVVINPWVRLVCNITASLNNDNHTS